MTALNKPVWFLFARQWLSGLARNPEALEMAERSRRLRNNNYVPWKA
jgi:hypothetical protein